MGNPSKNPVLLVHGIDDTQAVFTSMVQYLRDRGWPVHCIDLVPHNGDVGLDQLATQIQRYVESALPPKQLLDIVGFSMGGLVSRFYVQRLGGLQRVQRLVTVASPHNGTWTAYFRWNAGAAQMRPGSPFLTELNQSVQDLEQVSVTSLWTPFDLMIVPPPSSRLPVGEEITLPVLAHPLMLTDPRSLSAIAAALSS